MTKLDKIIALTKAFASSLIWGFGQLLNRQWAKAIFFFVFFALLIAIETITPTVVRDPSDDSFERIEIDFHYNREFDLFNLIPGSTMTNETSKGYVLYYYYSALQGDYTDTGLLHHAASINGLIFDEDVFVFTDQSGATLQPESRHLQFTPADLYDYLGNRLRELDTELDLESYEDQATADALASIETLAERAYREFVRNDFNRDLTITERIETVIESLATQTLIDAGHAEDDEDFEALLTAYIDDNYGSLRNEAEETVFDEHMEALREEHYERIFEQQRRRYFNNYYSRALNNYYRDLLLDIDDMHAFERSLQLGLSTGRDRYSNDDYNLFLVKLYFSYEPDRFEYFNDQFDSVYYNNRGFFIRGLWGLITLGESPQRTVHAHTSFGFFLPSSPTENYEARSVEIAGHHSTQLMLRGIISTLLLLYFIVIWLWNIRDAYKTALEIRKTRKVPSQRTYFKQIYEGSFEYIVLMPALFLITFIAIMPILFGMFVAFTNYTAENIPPGQLISWVGLDNFKAIFTLSRDGGMPFGTMFFRVFSWTVIWAVFATFTCFFGGFIQAVILNNNRVVFRKAWRGLLILPWAIPALISQMIFRVMFSDRGYINSVLNDTFVYDLLHRFGMLGRTFSEAGTGLSRLTYFGNENIQWITNEANPWFVRSFLIILNIWLGFPFFMALMSGVMTSINKSLYEAAAIDGATGFQQFRFITMPLVLVATSPLLIMTFAMNFNNFGVIYFITGGGPGGSFSTAYAGHTDILISWIYKLTTDQNIRWYSMASVFSILIFLIIGTISAWNFTRTRAFKEDM